MVRSTNRVNVAMWNEVTNESISFSCCNKYYAARKIERLIKDYFNDWIIDGWDYTITDEVLGTIII